MFRHIAHAAGAAVAIVATMAPAQTLNVGDPAPAIRVNDWIKGQGVTGFETGKVYVVEFWATWCPPCIESIPHLTKLQAKYKDQGVEIIGATRPDANNSRKKVESFVKEQGDRMVYHVAFDTDASVYNSYMTAARQGGIPTAFIVDRQGRLAWIGHPMTMDRPLDLVVRGVWDPQKFKEGSVIQQRIQQNLQLSEFDRAIADLDTLIKDYDDLFGLEARMLKFQILNYIGKSAEAMALARELVETHYKDDAHMLGMIAWGVATTPGDARDLDIALRAAQRAAALADETNRADLLDTLARVHFERGEIDKAIETQEKVLEAETDERYRVEYQRTLDEYKAKRG